MAKFRNISGDARRVGYGCPVTTVQPDDVLTVLDEAAINYAGQPRIWVPEDKAALAAEDEYNAALAMFAPPADPTPVEPDPEPAEEPVADTEETD